MKERIVSEVNIGMNNGAEYASKTIKSAVSLIESVSRNFVGETILEWYEGRWVPRTVKPGIKQLFSIRK